MSFFSYGATYLISAASVRLLRDLRARLFGYIALLAQDFYESRRTGELLSRIGADLGSLWWI